MMLAGTGHRPDKLLIGGRNAYDPHIQRRVVDLAIAALTKLRPKGVITGMALGWDTALAQAAFFLELPFLAYIPFEGQESRWPVAAQERYQMLLQVAFKVVVVSPGAYSVEKMQRRNERMVDDCDLVLALWNGTPGGTANCVKYAATVGRPVRNLWSSWQRFA